MGSSLVTSRHDFSSNSSGDLKYQIVTFPKATYDVSAPGSASAPYILTTLPQKPNLIIVHEYYDYTNGGAHTCSFVLYAENGFSTETWVKKWHTLVQAIELLSISDFIKQH